MERNTSSAPYNAPSVQTIPTPGHVALNGVSRVGVNARDKNGDMQLMFYQGNSEDPGGARTNSFDVWDTEL